MSSKKLGIFNYLSKPFVKLVEKYYPDAFIFVIVLSLLTFLLAINLTNASPVQTLEAWGNGSSLRRGHVRVIYPARQIL